MSIVKNIELLDLSEEDRDKLDAGALQHQRMSNITFQILEVREASVIIRVMQGRHSSENYADERTLITRTRELFEKFLPGKQVHPQAIMFSPRPQGPPK